MPDRRRMFMCSCMKPDEPDEQWLSIGSLLRKSQGSILFNIQHSIYDKAMPQYHINIATKSKIGACLTSLCMV